MNTPDGFGQDHTDVHRLDLGTLELLDLMWDRVRHHHLRDEAELRLLHHKADYRSRRVLLFLLHRSVNR